MTGEVDPTFIKELVMRLEPVAFAPGDFAVETGDIGHDAFFLSNGRASDCLRLLLTPSSSLTAVRQIA